MSSTIESAKDASTISRDSVAGILRALRSDERQVPQWNIVEVLEVLIDAGQFTAASDLAAKVAHLVSGDGRERLFDGYAALCDLMQYGDQQLCLQTLERLYVQIHNGGHSVPDKARIGLLLARGVALCVGVGSLSQRAILRSRNILSVELERLAQEEHHDLEAQVLTELAKCYLHSPTEDVRAARAILESFLNGPSAAAVSPYRIFDLKRVLFQAQRRGLYQDQQGISEESLRREAQAFGGVARALSELAIARVKGDVDLDRLERAADIFEENEFLSGAFEACFVLATHALDRGHNVVADKQWARALALAETGGFLHGKLLALLGLFQSAMLGENVAQARVWLEAAEQDLFSELSLGSASLNIAAAQQILGEVSSALETAKECEIFFKSQHLIGFQAQAANIVGTCEAQQGRWEQAKAAWSRAAALDEERNAFVSACEKHSLVAQALLMRDMTTVGRVKPTTSRKVTDLLESAHAILESFGELDDAMRVRARLCGVRAHLCVLCQDHVGAMRFLSQARGFFAALGLQLDVAMTDAFTALSMLEVGKRANPALIEEAVLHLQRALQFFSTLPQSPVRWKLLYYLAVAALLISNSKSTAADKAKWRELSAAWIRDAERESAELRDGEGSGLTSNVGGGYSEFSPGLQPAAIEEVKNALGIKHRNRRAGGHAAQLSVRSDEFMH